MLKLKIVIFAIIATDKRCIIDWKGNQATCNISHEEAPQYYTSQSGPHKTCLSKCDKFGYIQEWCFTSNDGSWDYCSSETRTKWVHKQNSIHYGPCKDECKLHDGIYRCITYNGYKSECKPESYSFVQAKTIEGKYCIGKCKKNNGEANKHYWCYDENLKQSYCAPPAKQPSLFDFFKNVEINCKQGARRNRRCIVNTKSKEIIVLDVAKRIEENKYFETVSVQEDRNPVYSYSMQLPQTAEDPVLPLVVRAKITGYTIIPYSLRHSNKEPISVRENLRRVAWIEGDEPRNLIGNLIGGQNQIYNVILQNDDLRKELTKIEKEIVDWVKTECNSVDMTVLVMYKTTIRPNAIGLNVDFLTNNKVRGSIKDQIVYNIRPSQEGQIKMPVIKKVTEDTKKYKTDDDITLGLW